MRILEPFRSGEGERGALLAGERGGAEPVEGGGVAEGGRGLHAAAGLGGVGRRAQPAGDANSGSDSDEPVDADFEVKS